ncbi:MAG: radical SAM protein [Deltaproteobacteria bacterium]|nr:radical SAM protein [Deltaproteobacteria bacterium]
MGPTDLRLQALRAGATRHGPQTVHLDVTNSCNTNCVTCWDHSPHLDLARSSSWKRQRVDVKAMRALLDDIQSLDDDDPINGARLQNVIVSGMGEPFTHPDIYELIADIKGRGLHLTIITNLVAADVDRVAALGVDALLVGVQGASEGSYLAFHPNFLPSHWAKLCEQLERLAGEPGVDVKQVQVICAHNAHELVAMIELAARTNAAQVNFKLASLKEGTEAVRLSPEQRLTLISSWIPEAKKRAATLSVTTNLEVFEAQARTGGDETAPIQDIGCFVGAFYARVTVEGTVLFCCNTDVVVGSLSVLPFSAWWRSARWEHWRRRMREGRYLESCSQCGKVNQNAALSARFRSRYGDADWLEVTGRGPGRPHPPAPLSRGTGEGGGDANSEGRPRRSLRVLS